MYILFYQMHKFNLCNTKREKMKVVYNKLLHWGFNVSDFQIQCFIFHITFHLSHRISISQNFGWATNTHSGKRICILEYYNNWHLDRWTCHGQINSRHLRFQRFDEYTKKQWQQNQNAKFKRFLTQSSDILSFQKDKKIYTYTIENWERIHITNKSYQNLVFTKR